MFPNLVVHISATAITILSLFCQLPVISAFSFRYNVDFEYCWNHTVRYLNTSNYDDKRQYFLWDRTHSYRLNLSQPLLTLFGCESLCNDGYELWPADDTLLRVVTWVLPACVLLVHFHFAPLGLGNQFAVITHLLGDPLDTLWSMMTRQEVNRRFYRRAKSYSDRNDFKHVATVWSAYDELGWGNPSRWFADALQERGPQRLNNPPVPNWQNLTRQNTSQHIQALDFLEAAHTRVGTLDANADTQERNSNGPTPAELYYIQLASHRLACNRLES